MLSTTSLCSFLSLWEISPDCKVKPSVVYKKKKYILSLASSSQANSHIGSSLQDHEQAALPQGRLKRDTGLSAGNRAAGGASRGLSPRLAVIQEEGNRKQL